jgi:D-alanyl-D-alanine carboxypeptidase
MQAARSHRALLLTLLLPWGLQANGQLAQGPDPAIRANIDQVVLRCLHEDGTPSASIALVESDQLFYAKAYGLSDLEAKSAAVRTTRYQLASISKTFTAQAMLLLEADGKLSLDDTVSKWYPELTSASGVTLRQLLNHTSGYPDHYPESYPAGPKGRATTPDTIIEDWGRHSLLFVPGTQYHYSNLEYEIAGRIIEKVSGQRLFAFMQERIFNPLHMSNTIDLDTIPNRSTAVATGYEQTALAGLKPAPYEGPGWSFGSGQVVTTATDLALWDIAFLKHATLPAAQLAEELQPARLANGSTYPSALGLFTSHDDYGLRLYHTGGGLGFLAVNMVFPDTRRSLVILTNTNAQQTYLKIADELTYLLVQPSENDRLARRVFTELQNGQLDRSLLSEDLNHYLNAERLRDYTSSLSSLGPIEAFSLSHEETVYRLTTRDYDVIAGGKRLRLHLLLLPTKMVQDVTITLAH